MRTPRANERQWRLRDLARVHRRCATARFATELRTIGEKGKLLNRADPALTRPRVGANYRVLPRNTVGFDGFAIRLDQTPHINSRACARAV
jgi:hypothetical protein